MAFCEKERVLLDGGYTNVDNKFIFNYLAEADGRCVAVYLMGLALTQSHGTDNDCSTIARKLDLSEEEVMAAFAYWEELGLVHITFDTPKQVIYLDVRGTATSLKKIKPSKYKRFSTEIQNVIKGRMLSPNELNEYYMFLENTTFEPEALVAVAKYCVELKGDDINYRYILTVARNQIVKGATTLAVVQDNLNSQQKYDEDLKLVFKALGISRSFEYQDREFYEKWLKDFGFTPDVIVAVAKMAKGKGVEKLDALLCEFFKKGAFSVAEIENYIDEKQHLTELAKTINRTIGVYYQSVDSIIDEYLIGWLKRGYDDETLIGIAKYCFRCGIRTLNGYANVLNKLYKNGVTTLAALDGYIAEASRLDEQIAVVLEKCGLERRVTANDRTLFRVWTEKWNLPTEVIYFAAEKACGSVNAIAYLNKVLASYKQKGIFTLQQAQAEGATTATTTASKRAVVGQEMQRATYTDEQLNALFTALDDSEE